MFKKSNNFTPRPFLKRERKPRIPGLEEPRVNGQIYIEGRNPEVRVNYERDGGEPVSEVMSVFDAKRLAQDMGLDLIEINGKAVPPVLRIADYSKYLYELKKTQKAKNRSNGANELKEVQLSVGISSHDIATKVRKATEFINEGHKVKVVLRFTKREMIRREDNKRSLYEFVVAMKGVAVPENLPRDDGNRSIVILKKK